MTRPKKPESTYETHAGFWGVPRAIDQETRSTILDKATQAGIDLPESFFESLERVAGEYHGRLTLKRPKPGEVKDALRLVAKQSRELRQTLQALDFESRAWIESSGLTPGAEIHFIKGTAALERELLMLEATASRAHENLPPKTRPTDPAKHPAAVRLRALFEWYGLPFTQTEPNSEIDYRGLAEVCLSWIFGDGKRVGHWLKRAQESAR